MRMKWSLGYGTINPLSTEVDLLTRSGSVAAPPVMNLTAMAGESSPMKA
jgi:hypothetical protein